MTPLLWAASGNENPAVARVLLDASANAKATDVSGRRAVDHARVKDALRSTDASWRMRDASLD